MSQPYIWKVSDEPLQFSYDETNLNIDKNIDPNRHMFIHANLENFNSIDPKVVMKTD